MKLILIFLCAVAWGPAMAQVKAPPLSDLEKLEQLDKAFAATRNLEAQVSEQSRQSKLACMKAFGHTVMCQCLTDNLPFVFSFRDYVAITTMSKEQNGYSQLDERTQKAYDRVPAVRDKCVRDSIK